MTELQIFCMRKMFVTHSHIIQYVATIIVYKICLRNMYLDHYFIWIN